MMGEWVDGCIGPTVWAVGATGAFRHLPSRNPRVARLARQRRNE